MNLERIWQHRGVLITALGVYKKRVEKNKKDDEELELDSDDAVHRLDVIEELLGELKGVQGPTLEGTPMGDAIAGQVYQAEDGTPLDVDSLDSMLRTVGIDAPVGAIGEWKLEKRREVYAWITGERRRLLAGKPITEAESLPDVIDEAWSGDPAADEPALEQQRTPEEVDALLSGGPWGVHASGPPGADEWALRRTNPSADFEADHTVEYPQKFGQLDRARLIAANLNALAREEERDVEPAAEPAEAGAPA